VAVDREGSGTRWRIGIARGKRLHREIKRKEEKEGKRKRERERERDKPLAG